MKTAFTFEDLLWDLGGFGKFQALVLIAIFLCKLNIGWSMLQMSYANKVPEWTCVGPYPRNVYEFSNGSLETCRLNDSSTNYTDMPCASHHFWGISHTVVAEWDLVCDRTFVIKLVTSIQMAGVLVGAVAAGQLADLIGRKKTTYGFTLEHLIVNVIAAFSVGWEMFAICRFFIGIGLGAILVVSFPYPLEFLPMKWRPLLSIMPAWAIGTCFFCLTAFLTENWSHLHIGCAVCGIPGFLGVFFMPESARWLAVKGRIKEAREVVEKIASINGKPVPEKTTEVLQSIFDTEQMSRGKVQKYSYLDLFKDKRSAIITASFCFFWFNMSVIYYGIYFGVSNLSGNLYLNIFLLAVVEIPPITLTFYTNNRFGRKVSALVMFVTCCASTVGCLVARFLASDENRDDVITGLSITAKMAIGTVWAVLQIWMTELYPTVTRNLGYGAANTFARVGGIAAPYMVDLKDNFVLSYIIMSALLAADILITLITPETKGKQLADSLDVTEVVKTTDGGKEIEMGKVYTISKPETKEVQEKQQK